jgi:hypothetical protein
MEDYYQEETNRLMNLRVALIKEFGVDVWEETVMQAFKNDTTGARDFYFLYSNISEKELQTK